MNDQESLSDDTRFVETIGIDYFPHQKDGIAYASSRANVVLNLKLGYGSTVLSIGMFNSDPSIKTALVICPAYSVQDWATQWKKWSARSTTLLLPHSSHDVSWGRKSKTWSVKHAEFITKESSRKSDADSIVMFLSYEKAVILKEQLDLCQWDLLIVDQAQNLKHEKSNRCVDILGTGNDTNKLPIPAKKHAFILPQFRSPIDIWPIIRFCDPSGLGKSKQEFVVRYRNGRRTPFGLDASVSSNMDELMNLMTAKFWFRVPA